MALEDQVMEIVCECNSFGCRKKIKAPFGELRNEHEQNHILIATDCTWGAELTDKLVSEHEGYNSYMAKL